MKACGLLIPRLSATSSHTTGCHQIASAGQTWVPRALLLHQDTALGFQLLPQLKQSRPPQPEPTVRRAKCCATGHGDQPPTLPPRSKTSLTGYIWLLSPCNAASLGGNGPHQTHQGSPELSIHYQLWPQPDGLG